MEFADAFLLYSAIAYYLGVLLPKPITKIQQSFWVEKLFLFVSGTVLFANLALNIGFVWLAYGVWWSAASCLSYLGYVQWNLTYTIKTSHTHQVAMWVWDALIALCCLLKF